MSKAGNVSSKFVNSNASQTWVHPNFNASQPPEAMGVWVQSLYQLDEFL